MHNRLKVISSHLTSNIQSPFCAGTSGAPGGLCFSTSTAAAAATTTTTTNGFLEYANFLGSGGFVPPYGKISPQDIDDGMKVLVPQTQSGLKELENELKNNNNNKDFDFIKKLERISFPLGTAWNSLSHLMAVKNSAKLREAYQKWETDVVTTFSKISQSEIIFEAAKDELATTMKQRKNDPRTRLLENMVKSSILDGALLQGKAKEEFNELKIELSSLSTKFSNNLMDSIKEYSLVISDTKVVQGMPKSFLQRAAHVTSPSTNPDLGPWTFTLDGPCVSEFLKHCKDRSYREKIYMASITKASELSSHDNSEIMKRMLLIRGRQSALLGYENYAQVSLERKMASSVQEISDLMNQLADKARPFAEKEVQNLRERAKKENQPLMNWDIPYWSERLREETFKVEEETLMKYFPIKRVLSGLFSLIEELFQVKIVPSKPRTLSNNPKEAIWNEFVEYYDVVLNEKIVAGFFIDPIARPGEKRSGAWMSQVSDRTSNLSDNDDVSLRIPIAHIVCNQAPAVPGQPVLMKFSDVETMFHEMGHALQHMLTKQKDADIAGINGIEWDIVELPSQMMENFILVRKVMNSISEHVDTKEPLPDDLFNKLRQSRQHMAGIALMRQIYIGAIDLDLHVRAARKDATMESVSFEVEQAIKNSAKKFSVIPPLPEDRFLNSFLHIFAGGYAAGYYSYLWAEVYAADAFLAFEEVMNQPQELAKISTRYRETVLGEGGGRHPSQVYFDFRGKTPEVSALIKSRLGC